MAGRQTTHPPVSLHVGARGCCGRGFCAPQTGGQALAEGSLPPPSWLAVGWGGALWWCLLGGSRFGGGLCGGTLALGHLRKPCRKTSFGGVLQRIGSDLLELAGERAPPLQRVHHGLPGCTGCLPGCVG